MTASKPEVLPCPFCGSDPLERAIEPHTHSGPLKALGIPDHPGSHVIECGCGAGMIAEAKEAVRAMWNRRETYTYQQARIAEQEADQRRLEFMIAKEAHIGWNREGEYCGVFISDGEDGHECLSGWGSFHEDPRSAIDAALAQQGKEGET